MDISMAIASTIATSRPPSIAKPGHLPSPIQRSQTGLPESVRKYHRESKLYKGVSQRPLGWKRRGQTTSRIVPLESTETAMGIRKWDGAARTSVEWDGLRRDPDLWYGTKGDCFVHLYEKGHSMRAPAFKVPMEKVVAINARPLLKRFLVERIDEDTSSDGSSSDSHVELYIPAPPTAERGQAFLYHTATRNFFAWIFGKSLVGRHLGGALVGLLNSMNEFRSQGENNIKALLEFIDEEGYTDMRNSPDHALAILFFAEHFRFKDMWIDAFAHCVGMYERLPASPGFEYISRATRAMITQSRYEMDKRLNVCGQRVGTFLSDDLSETHLGLSTGARAHLDKFRSFLQSYYIVKLGYYPPSINDGTGAFPHSVFREMASEFQKLYDFLVDTSLTSSDPNSIPMAQQGGICVLQNIQNVDQRFKHTSLAHTLPLLPDSEECTSPRSGRSFSWVKSDKKTLGSKSTTFAALSKATNQRNLSLPECTLVRAYRGFEKDCVFNPSKEDKHDKLSQADARKVRWILIYSTLQTLLAATNVPQQVRDTKNVKYSLSVLTAGYPPWRDQRPLESLIRTQSDQTKADFECSIKQTQSEPASPLDRIDIRPDIDWDAITHRSSHTRAKSDQTAMPSKTRTVRKAISYLGNMPELQQPKPNRVSFHEILIHGYGNGTNNVNISTDRLATTIPLVEVPERKSTSLSQATSSDALSSRWSHTSDEEHEQSSVSSTSRRQSFASGEDQTKLQIGEIFDNNHGDSALGLPRNSSSVYSVSIYNEAETVMEPLQVSPIETAEAAGKAMSLALQPQLSTWELERYLYA